MLDLEKFDVEKEGIVPIVDGVGVYEGRKFKINLIDGWYRLIFGSNVRKDDIAYAMQVNHRPEVKGFVFGDEFVPQSFDVLEKKFWVKLPTTGYRFGSPRAWTAGVFLLWEDGFWYFKKNWVSPPKELLYIKRAFDDENDIINMKDITPELRYLFFLYSLERSTEVDLERLQDQKLVDEDRRKLIEKIRKTVEFRIADAVKSAGGKFIRAVRHGGSRVEVVWKLSGIQYSSLVDFNTLQVKDAGLCVSGDDEKFNIKSLILTVRDFGEHGDYFTVSRVRTGGDDE